MYPELFHLGPVTVYSYGAMLALSFLTCAWLLRVDLARWHLPVDLADRIVIAAMVGGIVGAKLYFVLIEARAEFLRSPLSMLFSGAGLTFYGGFVLATACIAWVVRRAKVPVMQTLDILGPILILGYGIGRVGCLLSGDGDYGPPSHVPWAISFPHGTVPTTLRVHPTMAYETLWCVAIFAFLWFWLRKRPTPRGFMTGASLILAGTERFVTEFWRIDSDVLVDRLSHFGVLGNAVAEREAFKAAVAAHFTDLGLSVAQWISIALVVTGIVLLVLVWRREPVAPPVPEAT